MNCRDFAGAPVDAFPAVLLFPRVVPLWLCLMSMTHLAGPTLGAAPATQHSSGSLPPYFEANRGQADPRFAFLARGQRHVIHVAPDQVVIALAPETTEPASVVRLSVVGANPRAAAHGLEPLAGIVNYFIGN